jgi:hypothetical protein
MIMVFMIIITASRLYSRVHLLNLDSRVEDLVLVSQDSSRFLTSLMRVQCTNMATHCHLALGNSPNMEVVNFLHFIKTQNILKALEHIHLFWSRLHKD